MAAAKATAEAAVSRRRMVCAAPRRRAAAAGSRRALPPDAAARATMMMPEDVSAAIVMALALPMMVLTALFQIPDGVQAIAMSVLRGVNDTRVPAIVAITSFWVSGVAVGALAGFSLGFGPTGVWGGLLLGLSVASLILTVRMLRMMRRIRDGGRILLA